MRRQRFTTTRTTHICPTCEQPFVQPGTATLHDQRWAIELWCPKCHWTGDTLLTEPELDHYDTQLIAGTDQLTNTLAQLTKTNMRDYAERFTAALDADAVLPEDF